MERQRDIEMRDFLLFMFPIFVFLEIYNL